MISWLLPIAFNAQIAPLPATVTYSNPAGRLERVLPDLSAKTGLKLTSDDRMNNIVLTLRLSNASVKEVLAKIAEVTRGKWEERGQTLKLFEDTDSIAKEQEAAEERHRSRVHAMLAELHEAIEPKPPKKAGDEDSGDPDPPGIVIAKLLPSFDESEIAALPVAHRIVYSTMPRPLQRPLPQGSEKLFEQMIVALNQQPESGDQDEVKRLIKGKPYKTDVVISRNPRRGNDIFNFSINVYDADGKVITRQFTNGVAEPPDSEDVKHDKVGESPPNKTLHISAIDMARLNLSLGVKAPPEIAAIISKPTLHDPLEPVGSVLVAYADAEDEQLVVCLSDEMQSYQSFSYEDSLDTNVVWRFLGQFGAENKKGWVTMKRPINLADDIRDLSRLVDRRKLQEAVERLTDVRCPSMLDLVAAIHNGSQLLDQMEQGSLFPSLLNADDDELISSLALLDEVQLSTLLSGGKLGYSQTSAAFRARMNEQILLSARPWIQVVDDSNNFEQNDYRTEPTELVDSRDMPDAYVQLALTSESGLEPFKKSEIDTPRQGNFWDVGEVADNLYNLSPMPSKFRIGKQNTYELRVFIGPQSYYSESSTLYDISSEAAWLKLSEFPDELKKKIADMVEVMKRRDKDDGGSVGGTTPPR